MGGNWQDDPVYFPNGLQIGGMYFLFTCSPNSCFPAFLSVLRWLVLPFIHRGLEIIWDILHWISVFISLGAAFDGQWEGTQLQQKFERGKTSIRPAARKLLNLLKSKRNRSFSSEQESCRKMWHYMILHLWFVHLSNGPSTKWNQSKNKLRPSKTDYTLKRKIGSISQTHKLMPTRKKPQPLRSLLFFYVGE